MNWIMNTLSIWLLMTLSTSSMHGPGNKSEPGFLYPLPGYEWIEFNNRRDCETIRKAAPLQQCVEIKVAR